MDDARASYISGLWSIQESLLQSYRSIFITIQSIFISVSVALLAFGDSIPFFLMLMVVIGLYTNSSWVAITSRRALSVTFLQTLLRQHENPTKYPDTTSKGLEPFERLRLFQDDRKYRDEQIKSVNFVGNGVTRSALGAVIPCLFFVYWISSSGYIAFTLFPTVYNYTNFIKFYGCVSIVFLAFYLCLSLLVSVIREEKNMIYKVRFLWYFLIFNMIFTGTAANVHTVICW